MVYLLAKFICDPTVVSLHLESSLNEFSWYFIFVDEIENEIYFVLEIRWRGDVI